MTETRSIFDARRAFGRDYARFDAWFGAQNSPDSEAIWDAFATEMLSSFLAQSPMIWSCGVHPNQRARLALLLCEAARARMLLDNCGGDANFDPHESQLWDAALCVSRRAVENWEREVWRERGEFGGIYRGAAHRLADLYRRAGRTDERALRLYIAVFVGPNAAPTARMGAGAHISVNALLQNGAAISPASLPAAIATRYSLCLLLRNRSYQAPWLQGSLAIARQHSPQTGELLLKRLGLTEARNFKKSQAPAISQLVDLLGQIAKIRAAQQAATALAELREHETQAQINRELQEMARAKIEAEKSKPKAKRKRKRKAAPNETVIPLPPKPVSKEQLEFDKLFDETFNIEPAKAAKKPKLKPEPLDDWDDFLSDFEREFD